MFFQNYNTMSAGEVLDKVSAKPAACGGEKVSGIEFGKKFTLVLTGNYAPSLEYQPIDTENLIVTENGVEYKTPYSVKPLGGIMFLSHPIPGTNRSYHVILDSETQLATAFETWFGSEAPVGGGFFGETPKSYRQIYREVEKQCYFGYMKFSGGKYENEPPKKLHTTTNRLAGKGFHWAYEDGRETLTFFPSLIASTFVELNDPGKLGDSITISPPSDYIKISDELFIYTRWEIEFSGTAVISVIDLFTNTAVSLRYGFDEKDEFEYRFLSAKLTVTGNAAHFELIADTGEDLAKTTGMKFEAKGARYSYRPRDMHQPPDIEKLRKACREKQMIFEGLSVMSSSYTMAPTEKLIGRQFKVIEDSERHAAQPWGGKKAPVFEYDMVSGTELKWRYPGGEWQTEKYLAYEPAKDLFLFSHMNNVYEKDGLPTNLTVVVDFSNGLATVVHCTVGSWLNDYEASGYAKFGTLEYPGVTPPFARRHHFTTDLVGKSFTWSYSPETASIHTYSSPESYSWTIFSGENAGGPTWSSPCFYIKLREDAYMFQWVEENCNGGQGIMVFNPQIMHDAGYFFGGSENGIQLTVMGAYARHCGSFNINKYFDKTAEI